MSIEWTDAEREAVVAAIYDSRAFPEGTLGRDEQVRRIRAALDALAPFVADRERQAAARALYRASNLAKSRESGDVSWLTLRAMAYNVRAGEQP